MEKFKLGIYDQEAALKYEDDPLKDEVIERAKNKKPSPEKMNITINIKDLPPEVQAQILALQGIQMNPEDAIPPDMKTGAT